MSHLGRWLSALVDGELDGTERDRVLNHVAGCSACRQEANAMRALKRRLTALGDTCSESPIAGRLIELARGDQASPFGGSFSLVPWSAAAIDARGGGATRHSRLGWKIATGSATSALLAIGVIAFLLGNVSGAPPVPVVTPSVDSYLMQHTYDAGQEPARSAPGGASARAGGQSGGAGYRAAPASGTLLDPRWPATMPLGLMAGPIRSSAGSTPTPRPVASASARPAHPSSPTASAHASPGHSSHPHPASRSAR